MEKTAKGILENILYLVNKYGYMFYGNRIYYENRSQPPLLIQMMSTYYTYTNDKSFIIDNLEVKSKNMLYYFKVRMNLVGKHLLLF